MTSAVTTNAVAQLLPAGDFRSTKGSEVGELALSDGRKLTLTVGDEIIPGAAYDDIGAATEASDVHIQRLGRAGLYIEDVDGKYRPTFVNVSVNGADPMPWIPGSLDANGETAKKHPAFGRATIVPHADAGNVYVPSYEAPTAPRTRRELPALRTGSYVDRMMRFGPLALMTGGSGAALTDLVTSAVTLPMHGLPVIVAAGGASYVKNHKLRHGYPLSSPRRYM